jgi:hypothetical protein
MNALQITTAGAVSIAFIGGLFSVIVAIIGSRALIRSKREERIAKSENTILRQRLDSIYTIAQKVPDGYDWMVINKYTHLDKLHAGYCVIDPVRLEEFISDGLCHNLYRSREKFGKKITDLARFVSENDLRLFAINLEALIAGEVECFEMQKHIRDGKENTRAFNVKTVKDGAFFLSVYDEIH